MRKYLTTSQVAEMLDVHRATVDRWTEEGKIPHWITPGGRRRYRVEDIEALVEPVAPKPDTETAEAV